MVTVAALVGFASGLLANGGGFLLVPMFLLLLGLEMNRASGTSLVVASALTLPTLVVHVGLGDIDYTVAAAFAVRAGAGGVHRGPAGHPTAHRTACSGPSACCS